MTTCIAKHFPLSMLLGLALTAAGCRSYSIYRDYYPQANFQAYDSFSWMPASNARAAETANLPAGVTTIMGQRIKQAVQEGLIAKGLAPAALDKADLWVTYRLTTREGTRLAPHPYTDWTWNMYTVYEPLYVDYYERAVLTLSLIDRAKQQVVWQAEAVDMSGNWDEMQKVISEMLEAFPPRSSSR